VLLSLVYRLLRCLFGLPAVLVRSDLSKDAELLVLRHENQVLRRQLSGRLRWDQADRLWLTALSRLVSSRRWPEIFPVTPATILRWHRDLVARKSPRSLDKDFPMGGSSVSLDRDGYIVNRQRILCVEHLASSLPRRSPIVTATAASRLLRAGTSNGRPQPR
jgi:hypothetical protein